MDELSQLYQSPQLRAAAQTGALIFMRLLPVIAFSPVFGGQVLPKRLRIGLCVFLAMTLLPSQYVDPANIPVATPFYLLLAKEFVVGLSMSILLLVLFETVAAVGALVDLARGATMANVFDPVTQNQQSILAQFFTQFAIVLFMSVGGIQILVRALGESFILLKPYELLPPAMLGPAGAATPIGLIADLFVLTLRLAAPAVLILFMLDFALGVINRVAPQIQVYFLGLTTKGVVGLIVVLLGFGLFSELIIEQFARTLEAIRGWMATPGRI